MVSVIVVSWNSEEYIEACITALVRTAKETPLQIILIDNASKDDTVRIVEEKFSHIQVVKNSYNVGLSQAINKGAKLATGKYIMLLNPDVILMEDTIHKLYQFMEAREDIGACGPQFLWPNGKIQRSCRELPTFKNLFLEFSGIGRITKCSSWKMWYFNHKETREVEQPIGSCLMVRKELFDTLGGMDERYPIFMNDVNLCYRIKEAGHKLYFVADTNVLHYLGGSTRKVKRKMILAEHHSMYRYLRDHSNNRFLLTLYALLLLTSAFYRVLFSRTHPPRISKKLSH